MSYVNQTVNVQSFYFLNGTRSIKTFPKQIELSGQVYDFIDGLAYLVQKGQKVVKFFDMTDGVKTYHLKLEDK